MNSIKRCLGRCKIDLFPFEIRTGSLLRLSEDVSEAQLFGSLDFRFFRFLLIRMVTINWTSSAKNGPRILTWTLSLSRICDSPIDPPVSEHYR